MSQATGHATSPRDIFDRFLIDIDEPPALAFVRIDERGGYRFCVRASDGYQCGHDVADYDEVYLLGIREPTAAARLVDALESLTCEARRAVLELRTAGALVRGRRGPGPQTRDIGPVCRWRARR